jgi:5-methylcytosine-specific restriction endonuclease McrA
VKIIEHLPVKESLRRSMDTSTGRSVLVNGRRYSVGPLRTFAIHGCTCARCGRKGDKIIAWEDKGGGNHIDLFSGKVMMNRDHIIPKSKKGPNSNWNYQVMCVKCNTKKGNQETFEDRQLARFRAHWKKIHVAIHDGIQYVPKKFRFAPMMRFFVRFREGRLYGLSRFIAKVSYGFV